MAAPARTQPTTKTGRSGAEAITTRAATPTTEPAVMTSRGPRRSMTRPTGTPTSAETTNAAENTEVTATVDQPVSALIRGASTGKA